MNDVTANLVEALRRIADPRNTHFAGDAQVVAREALAAYEQAQAATPAPAPSEVWEASGKTGRMLFPTEPEARAWVAQFPASVAGGFEVYPVTVYRYLVLGQEKDDNK